MGMEHRRVFAKHVARELGVDRELIEGLVEGKKIKGVVEKGRSGQRVVLVDSSEIERLKAIIMG